MRTRIVPVLILLVTGLTTACAENSASLVIVQNQSPTDGCEASATATDAFLSHGIMDLGASRYGIDPQYIGWLVVANNLVSTVESHGIELNTVEIKEAQISLNLGSDTLDSAYTKFADYTFVAIPPGENRSVQVNLIPPNVAGRMTLAEGQYIEATATVQIVGERGGTDIKSNSIKFPITICNGCLVENIGPCDSATFPDPVLEGHSCNKSQDEPLHCCYDSASAGSDNAYRCPAVESTTTSSK